MKLCIASEHKNVTSHFGHCETFEIYTIENSRIVDQKSVDNPGHKPGFLPGFLANIGVNVIISGGMGGSAIDLFHGFGIDVITGVSGHCDDVAKRYISQELVATYSPCEEHSHHQA